MKSLIAAMFAVVLLSGCTDAERASLGAYGEQAKITCYSGAQVIGQYTSTGKVQQLDGDGIAFMNSANGRYVRAFADCIVEEM